MSWDPRRFDDEGTPFDRSLPPSQPAGWVDPDPLHVEPEPVRRHVAYQGWHPASKPIRHEVALVGLGVCLGIVIFALLFTIVRQLDPAPSSGQTTIDPPRDLSELRVGASAALSPASLPRGVGVSPLPGSEAPVPSPTGEVGTVLLGGWATYYATCSDCAAAGPLLQAVLGPGWKGQTITVVSDLGQVDLRLVTSCACGDRTRNGARRPTIIDVSLEAFGELAGVPARSDTDPGYVEVSIEIPGPHTTLPPTDTPRSPADLRMMLEVRGDELYR